MYSSKNSVDLGSDSIRLRPNRGPRASVMEKVKSVCWLFYIPEDDVTRGVAWRHVVWRGLSGYLLSRVTTFFGRFLSAARCASLHNLSRVCWMYLMLDAELLCFKLTVFSWNCSKEVRTRYALHPYLNDELFWSVIFVSIFIIYLYIWYLLVILIFVFIPSPSFRFDRECSNWTDLVDSQLELNSVRNSHLTFFVLPVRQTDRRINRRTEGQTGGLTGRRSDGLTDRQTDWRTDIR